MPPTRAGGRGSRYAGGGPGVCFGSRATGFAVEVGEAGRRKVGNQDLSSPTRSLKPNTLILRLQGPPGSGPRLPYQPHSSRLPCPPATLPPQLPAAATADSGQPSVSWTPCLLSGLLRPCLYLTNADPSFSPEVASSEKTRLGCPPACSLLSCSLH